ncbi:MAG: DUF2795 domain-containing protein [Solirubrobacterales bacterium]
MELGSVVKPAFESGPASRQDLIQVAEERGGGEGVVRALSRLPEGKRFAALRDLWEHLPDLPVEPPTGAGAGR